MNPRNIDYSSDTSVTDGIKRLAISIDGRPTAKNTQLINHIYEPQIPAEPKKTMITTISSISGTGNDFRSKYDIVKEIGKGGFSTVFQCLDKYNGDEFAVKVLLIIVLYEIIVADCGSTPSSPSRKIQPIKTSSRSRYYETS